MPAVFVELDAGWARVSWVETVKTKTLMQRAGYAEIRREEGVDGLDGSNDLTKERKRRQKSNDLLSGNRR